MAAQPQQYQLYPQQQLSFSASPYLYSASPRPAQHTEPPPSGTGDSVVIINPHVDHHEDIDLNKHDEDVGEWSANLKECFETPQHCLMAIFWPCGIAAKVTRVTTAELSPTLVGALFALALLGDIVCTALAWVDVYSSGNKPHFLPNLNLYYLAGKSTTGLWSIVGYICGVLFVAGVWALRFKTQQFYHIPRRFWFDLYATLFCTCCSMAQISKHVDEKNRQQGQSSGQVDVLPVFP